MNGLTSVIGVRCMGKHGVLTHEHNEAQVFEVDVLFLSDFSQAVKNDNINNTVSYVDVAEIIKTVVEGEHRDLIETLAHDICQEVLSLDGVLGAEVTVKKPDAPITFVEFKYMSVKVSLGASITH